MSSFLSSTIVVLSTEHVICNGDTGEPQRQLTHLWTFDVGEALSRTTSLANSMVEALVDLRDVAPGVKVELTVNISQVDW